MKKVFFEGQTLHLIGLALLLSTLYASINIPGFNTGQFSGVPTLVWALLAIANAIVHQIFVFACWRAELHGKHLTRLLGERAFVLYSALFTVFLVLRPTFIFALGWANRGTLYIHTWVGYCTSFLLLIPFIYTIYSIVCFFTFRRACGIDHFDQTYRRAPLVHQGIFQWTPNAMYTFGLLVLWIPAFLFQSVAELIIAALSHAYAWVHYFATEKPDMAHIYGHQKEPPITIQTHENQPLD
ncbi:MAG: methyltransferase [Acidobacteriota bacterium]|nr:methyltransferase [Acidobacteriota bacterium]